MVAFSFQGWPGVVFLFFLIGLFARPCTADLQDLMKAKGRKVLFLGDSNTFSGLYIAYFEGYLRTRFPAEDWELINLGLPSETLWNTKVPIFPVTTPSWQAPRTRNWPRGVSRT